MKLVMKDLHLNRCPTAHSKKSCFLLSLPLLAQEKSFHYENEETESHSEIPDILKLLGTF